jgi:hypothetical protein
MFQAFPAIVQIHACVGNVPYNPRAAKRRCVAPVTPEEKEVPPAHITWEVETPAEEFAEKDVVEEEEAPEERRPVAQRLSRMLPLAPRPAVAPRIAAPMRPPKAASTASTASSSRAAADDPRFATTDSPNREAFRILQEISKQVSERLVGSMGKIMKTQKVVGVC